MRWKDSELPADRARLELYGTALPPARRNSKRQLDVSRAAACIAVKVLSEPREKLTMMLCRRMLLVALLAVGLASFLAIGTHAETGAPDPLPSWNDGPTKRSIIDFVTKVTKEGGPDYVAPPERIATFDNDG